MTGVVVRVLLSKGFGFVRGADGLSRFVHARDVVPIQAFDTMREGQAVEFEPTQTERGARAVDVRVTSAEIAEKEGNW